MDSQTSPAVVPQQPVQSGVKPLPLQNISANPAPLNPLGTPGTVIGPLNTPEVPTATPVSQPPLPGGLPPRPAPAGSPPATDNLPPKAPDMPNSPPPAPVVAKPATAPKSSLMKIVLGLLALVLLLGGGYYAWTLIGPQTAPTVPEPTPVTNTIPTPSTNVTEPSSPDDAVACTMDAKLCPDGSYVGRSGPNCEFDLCPGEVSKGGVSTGSATGVGSGTGSSTGSTGTTTGNSASQTTSAPATTTTANWDMYKNPTYFLTFEYPAGWEVRDLKPYPRSDIKFRHGYGPRTNFAARGKVEASTLPMAELIEQVKKEEGGTATDQPGHMMGTYAVTVVRISKGTATVDHWFVRAHDYTYHFTATGTSPEVVEIAKTYKIE